MSQQKKLEKVLDLLINEDTARAEELLHQLIVEKSRSIYESIVDEEDREEDDLEDEDMDDEVGGDETDDFTKDIKVDKDDIDSDEMNDGEAGDELDMDMDADSDADDDRLEDLEDQLAKLRAEFDALLADEAKEEEHADLDIDMHDDDMHDDMDMESMLSDSMYESKTKRKEPVEKFEKMTKANKQDAEDTKHKKAKVEEETQFTNKAADTNQRSANPGFAGTGKHTPKGAEQDKSAFTSAPAKPSYGGKASAMGKGTGGEYGVYNAEHADDETLSDNVDEKAKSVAKPANVDKWSGTGKESGNFGTQHHKSPLTKAPGKSK